MLKDQLELLQKEFTTLQQKITTKLQSQQTTITETNRKLEELTKENQANEKVLEQLLKEFKELGEQLE